MNLSSWLEDIRVRTRDDYDEMIAVIGYVGNGKSSLAWWLGHALDPTFTHERMAFSSEEMQRILADIGPGQVAVLDEGVEGLYSRDSMTRPNKQLVKWLDVCRARRAILVVCMAHVKWLDDRVRGDRARWGVEVPSRGRAVVREPRRAGPFDEDTSTTWVPRFSFRFPAPRGPDWDAYLARKGVRVATFDPTARPKRARRKRQEDE